MTEREAWLRLAGYWGQTHTDHDGDECTVDGSYGLCINITRLRTVSERTRQQMRYRLVRHVPRTYDTNTGYFWTCTKAGARSRVRMCLKLAAECAKESRKRRGKK
jgi:hypothetical protein